MEAKKSKLKNKLLFFVLPLLVVAVFIIGVLIVFSNKLVQSSKPLVAGQVDYLLQYYSSEAEKTIEKIGSAASSVATMVGTGDITEKKAMEILCNQLPIENAAIIDAEGIGKDIHNEEVTFPDFNFHGSMKLDSNYYMYDGDGIIEILVPIVRDSYINKAIVLYYNTDDLQDILDASELGAGVWIAVVENEGKIVNSYTEEDVPYLVRDSVLLDEFRNQGKNGAVIINNIHRGRAGNLDLAFTDGEKKVHYANMKSIGWSVVMGVPENYYIEKADDVIQVVIKMMKWLAGCILLLIAVLIFNKILEDGHLKQRSDGLVKLAETDQLTGLFNKVTTEQRIRDFISESPDTQSLMFVLDVDNFKKINDTMGHSFGDEVLKDIGQGLKAQFRSSDIIGRAGGDEFIILLKGLKSDEFLLRESRKLDLFFKNLQVGGYVKYSVSASIGACVFPRDADSFEGLYKRADEALYKAKKRGKNQVAFYSSIDGKVGVNGDKFKLESEVSDESVSEKENKSEESDKKS